MNNWREFPMKKILICTCLLLIACGGAKKKPTASAPPPATPPATGATSRAAKPITFDQIIDWSKKITEKTDADGEDNALKGNYTVTLTLRNQCADNLGAVMFLSCTQAA